MPPDRDDPQADLEAAKRRLFPHGVPDDLAKRLRLRLEHLPDVLGYPTPDEAVARLHRFLNPATTTTATATADALRAWWADSEAELGKAAAELPPSADDEPDPHDCERDAPTCRNCGRGLAHDEPCPLPDDDCDDDPACALCGCTEQRACFPTCWWVQADPNVCSKCAEHHKGIEAVNALIGAREQAHTCPRCTGPWLPVDGDCDTCGYPGPLVGELCEGCRAVAALPEIDVGSSTASPTAPGPTAAIVDDPEQHPADPEVIYRWDDQAHAVVVVLDGEPCGKLRLRPELLHQVPPDLDDMIARLRRATEQADVRREADLVILAISLAVHAHDEDTAQGVRAFPGVASMLDDQAPIGPGWGVTREQVRRRGAQGRTPAPTS